MKKSLKVIIVLVIVLLFVTLTACSPNDDLVNRRASFEIETLT